MTLRDLINHPTSTIVDVREPWEFNSNHVDGAINIPLAQTVGNLLAFESFTPPIILCCQSGNRSEQATNMLRAKGISQVYNGGSWQEVKAMIF